MYSCMLAWLYQFVVLKHAVSCCHFKGKFWWNCCYLDVCLIRFSEPLLIYFAFAINRHFQARHDVCHKATSTFNILTFSSQFTASHYRIRRNLRATGVSTVYDVKIATKIWTEKKVSASQTGLSHDDIREEDSLSNVTSTTRRHVVHARQSLKLEQRPRVWHSKNDKRNALF